MSIHEIVRLIYDELHGWLRITIRSLPNFLVALVVVVLFNVLARLVRKALLRGFNRVSNNPALNNLSGTVAVILVNAAGLFIVLGVLGLDKTVTSLLAGAGVLALAVGFAFQDLTTNFISGTFIALQQPIQVGDVVETNGFTGKVVDIKLRSVVLNNFQGQEIEIPSKDVFQKTLVNYSRTGQRRIEVAAGISYLDDLDKAQRVATEAIRSLPFAQKDQPIEMHYRAFAADSIQFIVWFWVTPAQFDPTLALSEAIKTLKKAFDANELLLMFPLQTIDLKKRQQQESQKT